MHATTIASQCTYIAICCVLIVVSSTDIRYSEIPRLEALVAQADAEEQQQSLQLTESSSDNGTEEEVADVIRKGPMLGDTVTEHHVSACSCSCYCCWFGLLIVRCCCSSDGKTVCYSALYV
jgi:hypothetical protein